MSLDFSMALPNLKDVSSAVLRAAERGIGRALLQLKTDMITQRPTAPIKEGFLRGSTSIHVQDKELPVPLGPRENAFKKIMGYQIPLQPGKLIGLIGLNVPYAARTHEVPMVFRNWPGGTPSTEVGNKYLESKMANNKELYKKIVVNSIKEEEARAK